MEFLIRLTLNGWALLCLRKNWWQISLFDLVSKLQLQHKITLLAALRGNSSNKTGFDLHTIYISTSRMLLTLNLPSKQCEHSGTRWPKWICWTSWRWCTLWSIFHTIHWNSGFCNSSGHRKDTNYDTEEKTARNHTCERFLLTFSKNNMPGFLVNVNICIVNYKA